MYSEILKAAQRTAPHFTQFLRDLIVIVEDSTRRVEGTRK